MRIWLTDRDEDLYSGPLLPSASEIAPGIALQMGVPVPPTSPAQFAAGQWSVETGGAPGQIVLTIAALPDNGRTPITALQYNVGAGWVALSGTGTGARTITQTPGQTYPVTVRAVNAVGVGPAAVAKQAVAGAATVAAGSAIEPVRAMASPGGVEIPTAAAFTAIGGTPTYALVSPPAGVTINAATGVVTALTDTRRVAPITVRASVGSSTADQSFAATIGARYGIAIPKNEIFGNTQTQLDYIFDRFRVMGIRELRMDMIWLDMQPTNAAPNWATWPGSEYVMVADTAARYGMDLIYCVHMTPAWARLSGANYNGPGTPSAYASFCANVATQFTSGGRRLIGIEVWNEPNLSGPGTFWQYGRPASELAAMQIAAHAAVKALSGAAGQVRVGMGGLSAVPTTGGDANFRYTAATEWLNALYAVSGWRAANDFLAVHPYTYPFPWNDGVSNNDGFEVLTALRAIAVVQGDGAKPWWLTEYGAPTNAAGSAVSNTAQRQMFFDLFDWTAQPANAWVTKFHWYSYYDRAALTSTDPEDGFGIFGTDEMTEKLVPAAMRSVRVGNGLPLSPYYGVGPGRIAIHLDADSTTKDGSGNVTAFQNRGGAGAVFDAAVSGAAIPLVGKALQMTIGGGMPVMATPVDLIGVRLMWVMNVSAYVNGSRFFGGAVSSPYGFEVRFASNASGTLLQLWSDQTGTATAISVGARSIWPTSAPMLLEMEISPAAATAYKDGVLLGTVAHPWAQFLVENLGKGQVAGGSQVGGLMGDILGVTLGTGADAAIAAARSYLNTRFSLGLAL